MDLRLKVRIISPKQIIFDGEAYAVSSINALGNFDILPEHSNFITLIENNPIIITKLDKTQMTFNFDLAIVYHTNNKVSIYTEIQLTPQNHTFTDQKN